MFSDFFILPLSASICTQSRCNKVSLLDKSFTDKCVSTFQYPSFYSVSSHSSLPVFLFLGLLFGTRSVTFRTADRVFFRMFEGDFNSEFDAWLK